MSDDGVIIRTPHGGPAATAEITLDRPGVMNALSTAMAARLAAVCAELAADRAIRAIVLAAAGRAFCVGADLKERAAMSDAELMAQRPVFRAAFGAVLARGQKRGHRGVCAEAGAAVAWRVRRRGSE